MKLTFSLFFLTSSFLSSSTGCKTRLGSLSTFFDRYESSRFAFAFFLFLLGAGLRDVVLSGVDITRPMSVPLVCFLLPFDPLLQFLPPPQSASSSSPSLCLVALLLSSPSLCLVHVCSSRARPTASTTRATR